MFSVHLVCTALSTTGRGIAHLWLSFRFLLFLKKNLSFSWPSLRLSQLDDTNVQLIKSSGGIFLLFHSKYNKFKLKIQEIWNSWQCGGWQNSLLWNIKQTASLFKRHLSPRIKVNIKAIYSVFMYKNKDQTKKVHQSPIHTTENARVEPKQNANQLHNL